MSTNEIISKISEWKNVYLEVNALDSITPYIHMYTAHLPQLLEKHEHFACFTQEGAEHLNDFLKTYYFRSSSKIRRGKEFIKQVLKKRNRIELNFE